MRRFSVEYRSLSDPPASIGSRCYTNDHGTTFATRLTVIDKLPADDPTVFPVSPGTAPDAATLMHWIGAQLPPRLPVDSSVIVPAAAPAAARSVRGYLNRAARTAPAAVAVEPEGVALDYEIIDALPEAETDDDDRSPE